MHRDKLMQLVSRDDVERIWTVRTLTSDKSFLIGTGLRLSWNTQ